MKLRFFAQVLTGFTLAVCATATTNQPSHAQSNKFFCSQLGGVWSTFARTPRGNVRMIRWVTETSPPWTPQHRCQEVTKRFQRYHDNGTLKYVKTGRVNNQNVICTTTRPSDSCNRDNVLFTLQPGSNPENTLRMLLDLRGLAAGNTVNQSGSGGYVDVDDYLNRVPVEEIPPSTDAPGSQPGVPWWDQPQ